MKLKITQNDINKPTLAEMNTGDKCIIGRVAKRAFGTKYITVRYFNTIEVRACYNGLPVVYDGDKKMGEFLKVLDLVVAGKISRKWLRPCTFNLKKGK